MRNLQVPSFVKIVRRTLGIEAHTRGLTEPGTPPQLARGRGARWVGSLELAPMTKADAFAFRAWLHRLRGAAGSFLLDVSTIRGAGRVIYTDGTRYTDGTTFADVLDASDPIANLAAGATFFVTSIAVTAGTIMEVSDASGSQVVRAVAVSGTAGSLTVTVRPAIRRAMTSPTVRAATVSVPLRIVGEAPAVPIVPGGRSTSVTIDCEEAY